MFVKMYCVGRVRVSKDTFANLKKVCKKSDVLTDNFLQCDITALPKKLSKMFGDIMENERDTFGANACTSTIQFAVVDISKEGFSFPFKEEISVSRKTFDYIKDNFNLLWESEDKETIQVLKENLTAIILEKVKRYFKDSKEGLKFGKIEFTIGYENF